jgi:hypothetical protein
MRERAAKECDVFMAYLKAGEATVDSDLGKSIRAIPTTFTDAELLAAAMQLPEVQALVSGSDKLGFWMSAALCDPAVCDEMKIDIHAWLAALAPFTKVAS